MEINSLISSGLGAFQAGQQRIDEAGAAMPVPACLLLTIPRLSLKWWS